MKARRGKEASAEHVRERPAQVSPEDVLIDPKRYPEIVDDVDDRLRKLMDDRRENLLRQLKEVNQVKGLARIFWAKLSDMKEPHIYEGLRRFARRENLIIPRVNPLYETFGKFE